MPRRQPPFVWVEGQPYLVVNYDLDPTERQPLPVLVERLVAVHDEDSILLLRPLNRGERAILRAELDHATVESWGHIVVYPADKFHPRTK